MTSQPIHTPIYSLNSLNRFVATYEDASIYGAKLWQKATPFTFENLPLFINLDAEL